MPPVQPNPATVSLVDTTEGIAPAVARAMEAADWRSAIPLGADVALKPNLGWDLYLPGAVTSSAVVEAVIRVLRERAGRIYLVEADQVLVACEQALRQTGLDRACRRLGVEWVNLSRGGFVRVTVPGARRFTELELPEILTRTTLVTVPVMKTHAKTVVSGAIKNQWGCLPKMRHNYHPWVDEVLHDLARVLRPAFSVLDGVVALEGDGPKSGRPRVCNLVLASADPVALDTVAARVMGMDRFPIGHLDACAAGGVGVRDWTAIRVVDGGGEPCRGLPRLSFRPARHNLVSKVETKLRLTAVSRLLMTGPPFRLLCWGARVWYFVWYFLLRGRKLRDRALRACPAAGPWTEGEVDR